MSLLTCGGNNMVQIAFVLINIKKNMPHEAKTEIKLTKWEAVEIKKDYLCSNYHDKSLYNVIDKSFSKFRSNYTLRVEND